MTTTPPHPPQAGDLLELTVGEVVHGGWCVSRQDDTAWVIFVRHALPGERVRVRITQATARFARADAVEILVASASRVRPPCRFARPAGCGGCDWQHASLPAQRELKAAVVRQQLARIAGLDREVEVEELPGTPDGLGWRTAVTFAVGKDGAAGLRAHRSHDIVPVDTCLIAHPLVTSLGLTGASWPGARSVEADVVPATQERAVVIDGQARRLDQTALPGTAADAVLLAGRGGRVHPVRGRGYLTQRAAGRDWRVSAGGFWQVHPAAADVLGEAVLAGAAAQPGESVLDLYCGAGLFAGLLAGAVGPDGSVTGIEHDEMAVRDARHNLRAYPWARVHRGDVGRVLAEAGVRDATVCVLDPPRTGAERPVIDVLCARDQQTGRLALRRIVYVSCDPATLARDLRLLRDGGWQLTGLRAFDAFPMTHHVECLAVLDRD